MWRLLIFLHPTQKQSQNRATYVTLSHRKSSRKTTGTMLQRNSFISFEALRFRSMWKAGGEEYRWILESLWHLIIAFAKGLLSCPLFTVTACCHPTASRRQGDNFWGPARTELLFPLLLRVHRENLPHPWMLKIGVVLSSALIAGELCSTPPSLLRRDGNPMAPIAGCQNRRKTGHITCLPLLETKRQGGCEDGGRNPFVGMKLKHFNMLFTLNFFLFLEGCNQIKTIILWNNLKLSRKVWKKMALFKLLPRMKLFIVIITLTLHKDGAIISNLEIRKQDQADDKTALSGAV